MYARRNLGGKRNVGGEGGFIRSGDGDPSQQETGPCAQDVHFMRMMAAVTARRDSGPRAL